MSMLERDNTLSRYIWVQTSEFIGQTWNNEGHHLMTPPPWNNFCTFKSSINTPNSVLFK